MEFAVEDEFDDFLREQLEDDEFRLEYDALEYDHLDRAFRKNGIYLRRFQWWYPWNVTDWWQPRIFSGGDEWCNVPVCFVIPPLGCFVIYWRPRLRFMPCAKDWAHLNDFERADYAPCGYMHDGRIRNRAHHHSLSGIICSKASNWLESFEDTGTMKEGISDEV